MRSGACASTSRSVRPASGPSRTRLGLRSEEHTSELQSLAYLVCRLLLEKKKKLSNPHLNMSVVVFCREHSDLQDGCRITQQYDVPDLLVHYQPVRTNSLSVFIRTHPQLQ